MATESQVASNRLNSRRSTGPRTAEGKEASRRNSCRHGLAGSGGVVAEGDRAKVEARLAAFRAEFRPETEFERGLVEQMAVDSVRLDRCREAYLVLCDNHAIRSTFCWDEDRRAEAEEVAARLGWDPAWSRRRLEQDRHGVEVLIERWEGLQRILGEVGAWDEAQRSMALDLLGVPVELRDGTTAVDPPAGQENQARAFRLELVEAELARLRGRKAEALDEIDELDRVDAEAGVGAEFSKPLRLIQRYEAACWRRQQEAARFLRERARATSPVMTLVARPDPPKPAARPQTRPRPEPINDRPFRPPGSKPMASMTLDELFEFYDVPPLGQEPAGPVSGEGKPPRPNLRT